jgi:hypothetical protein
LALLLQHLVVIGTLAQEFGAAIGAALILAGDAVLVRGAIVALWAKAGAAGTHVMSLLLGHAGASDELFPMNTLGIVRRCGGRRIDKSRSDALCFKSV